MPHELIVQTRRPDLDRMKYDSMYDIVLMASWR
jgi:hypothetical protein